jgi:putative FmdB family regulatory protein
MPMYIYEHLKKGCAKGKRFEIFQGMKDDALESCPGCGKAVRRLICAVNVNKPISNTDLKSMGFAKLVRRDKGVYENVTALPGESKLFEAGKPHTRPDLKRRIKD